MSPIPYGFLPVNPEHAVHDAPLWRDGKSTEPRLSGELLLTLIARTPLIVGNHQHRLDERHSELLPQMLDDGRVLLGATSLKGMLRSVMASLLQAPMEHVAEHHYTYRPNLGFCAKAPKREVRAAIINRIEGEGSEARVTIALLPKESAVVFVREAAQGRLGQPAPGDLVQRTIQNVTLSGTAPRMRLEAGDRQEALNHRYFLYRGGIDGAGHLARAFGAVGVYQAVLVPAEACQNAEEKNISQDVVKGYYQTQQILADDKHGHLSPGHPLVSGGLNINTTQQAIRAHEALQINQLVYVEYDTNKLTITSMGHHFQYRWGYTSSVRYKNRLLDGKGQLRAELALHPQEKAGDDKAPQQLTGARLLFGYTVDKDQKVLAEGNFKRLAGRIAFNTAIEVPGDKFNSERFVNEGDPIQLHILGTPRPSAVEFYVKQKKLPKELSTYGDLPSDPGGELAGRKFYRHQPDAIKSAKVYESNHNNTKEDERGTCVRYLSAFKSEFRCTLRFDSLRPWELGALLASLDPSLIATTFSLQKNKLGYIHKLGYGKPLGLGSVRIKIDKARWQENDAWQWQFAEKMDSPVWNEIRQQALNAFKAKLEAAQGEHAKAHLEAWLKAREWSDHGQADYPTAANHKGEQTIFDFHSNLRKAHAEVRRGTTKNFNDLRDILESKP